MLKITSNLHKKQLPISTGCEFKFQKSDPRLELRAYVSHQGIFYLKSLTGWVSNDALSFFPESPGTYTLAVEWRLPDGNSGWAQYVFDVVVVGGALPSFEPQHVTVDEKLKLWLPTSWEANLLTGYEQGVFDQLAPVVKPGWVIYDVGANMGIYSIRFAHMVGEQGQVYSFEANPLCVYFLRANLGASGVKNAAIIPCALLDERAPVRFTINYGNSGLGITQSSVFYGSKMGHEITVDSFSLDELQETYAFRRPDLIKVDIEGAEGYALKGMLQTIKRYRPVIVLEVHGQTAARQSFELLDPLGYRYESSLNGMKFESAAELLAWFPETVMQFFCFPK